MNTNTEDHDDSAVGSVQDADKNQLDENNFEEVEIDDQRSTWAGRRTDLTIEPYVLERYYVFLRGLAISLTVLIILFISIACIMAGILIFNGDFEYIIFNDGTDALCILDPKIGAIKQYE